MAYKEFHFQSEAREGLFRGAKTLTRRYRARRRTRTAAAMDAVEAEEAKHLGDERTGMQILRHALREPARQLAENSGEDGGVVINEMRTHQGYWGFDAAERKYVDLVAAGVIDCDRR
jgi:chaperonin GroEL (HSP60 family)